MERPKNTDADKDGQDVADGLRPRAGEGNTKVAIARHVERFIANMWQAHPFCEGNTRTTAVFMVKCPRKLGFDVSIDEFLENSRFFRNALVRANYDNVKLGVTETMQYLDMFFDNLLFGARHELKSRELHIMWTPEATSADSEKDGSDAGRS